MLGNGKKTTKTKTKSKNFNDGPKTTKMVGYYCTFFSQIATSKTRPTCSHGSSGRRYGRFHRVFAHPKSKRTKNAITYNASSYTPTPWALDLALIFNWEELLDDDEQNIRKKSLEIILDGSNIAWNKGEKLRKRFKCRQFPIASAIEEALNYHIWQDRVHSVTCFLPKEYVVGNLTTLYNGGGLVTVNTDIAKYLKNGIWVNQALMNLVDEGRINLIEHKNEIVKHKKSADDLHIIAQAKEMDAFICSNDKFRDHRNEKAFHFPVVARCENFRLRRFEHTFLIAPGLME